MDFMAIDFETANRQASSACQLAVVVVQQSQIVWERAWLIRPPGNRFSKFNIAIHGIRPADVAQAPQMDEVWQELQSLVGQHVIVAHNARFDINVLLASLAHYNIHCQEFQYQCTRMMARRHWPHLPKFGLKSLGDWLGISFQHHDALEDARCCAKIALAIEASNGTATFEQVEQRLGIRSGAYQQGAIRSPSSLRSGGEYDLPARDHLGFPITGVGTPPGSICMDRVRQSCIDQPLLGKNILMLGTLRGLDQEATRRFLGELGANIQVQIDQSTHYVVASGIGISEAQQTVEAFLTSHQSAPQPTIRVLSERQFRALLPGGAYPRQ